MWWRNFNYGMDSWFALACLCLNILVLLNSHTFIVNPQKEIKTCRNQVVWDMMAWYAPKHKHMQVLSEVNTRSPLFKLMCFPYICLYLSTSAAWIPLFSLIFVYFISCIWCFWSHSIHFNNGCFKFCNFGWSFFLADPNICYLLTFLWMLYISLFWIGKLTVGSAEAIDGTNQPSKRLGCSWIWNASSMGSSSKCCWTCCKWRF